MKLDVNTPLGQDAIKWAKRGEAAFLEANPHLRLVETDQSKPAAVDGILYTTGEDGNIKAVVETKTRYMTLAKLMGEYEGRFLLNNDKLESGRALALSLRCSFLIVVVLAPSKLALVQEISNDKGDLIPDVETEMKTTRATTNGGTVLREVAYIDMTKAKQYKTKSL
jgi:hypothetical protein